MDRILFSKELKLIGGCDLEAAIGHCASLGVDGVDLTVRSGGYVEPDEVASALPMALDAIEARGLSVPLLTTEITDGDTEYARRTFEIADRYGIEAVKLGYWRYDGFGTANAGLATLRSDLDGIAERSREYNVTPVVHVHSGRFLTAEATLLAEILSAYDPATIGAYADFGHMAVEGADAGWILGLDLLAEHLAVVAVKDYRLEPRGDGWEKQIVPLGDGLVPWDEAFSYLDSLGFDGPISLHTEYDVDGLQPLLERTEADLAYLEGLLG